jgi:biopolymer transport protein ExbD
MADIEAGGGGGHKGDKGRKKKSVRVDFTPLVDLGFLLITFFMLTTSMTRPKTMEIQKPKPDPNLKDDEKNKLKASQAMTIFLTKDNKIVYYFGLMDPNKPLTPEVTNYGVDGIRKILKKANQDRNPLADSIQIYKDQARFNKITPEQYKANRKRIEDQYADRALVVLIKADDTSTYKNLVDILDEMSITNIRSYAIVDITPAEVQLVKSIIK